MKMNLLGKTLDEIISIEGPLEWFHEKQLDGQRYIHRIYYSYKKIYGYNSTVWYYFSSNKICIAGRYTIHLSNKLDAEQYMGIFNGIKDNVVINFGEPQKSIIDKIIGKYKYIWELDIIRIMIELNILPNANAYFIEIWYD
jgi:hypothetical protein